MPCHARRRLFPGAREKRPSKPDFCSGRKSDGTRGQLAHDRSFSQRNVLPRSWAPSRKAAPRAAARRWRVPAWRAPPRPHRAVPARRLAIPQGRPLMAGRTPAGTGAWLRAGYQACPGLDGLDTAAGVEGGCARFRAAGQCAPSSGGRAGRFRPRQWRGCAVGHRPGPRARSCRSSPPAGPGRPAGSASPHGPPVRPFLFSRFRGPAAAGGCRPSPARPGLDLTRREERSVRRRDATDGPPPGTHTAPGWPAATPPDAPGAGDDRLLTMEEVTAELRVSRAAFYRWRRAGAGPAVVRLPGGGVRVRRSALTAWLRQLEADTQDGQEQTADG